MNAAKSAAISKIELNDLQQKAYELVMDKKNIFITGMGGSGKSMIIKKIKYDLESLKHINVAITSLTGISANLIGGVTLHSYLGIQLGTGTYKKLYKMITENKMTCSRWRRVEVLIIDEVSMLSIELFEKLEKLARKIRCNELPFGGIQIILTGDFLQLPPVGQSEFIFESSIWDKVITETLYLTQIMRQTDETFMRILNKIRLDEIDEEVENILKSREIKYLSDTGLIPTMLFSINSKVDATNESYYNKLDGPEFKYQLKYKWHKKIIYKEKYDTKLRFQQEVDLKVGAQVMHLINLPDGSLFNGSRGVVKAFDQGLPLIHWSNGETSLVSRATLDIEEQDELIMSYSQLPLKLAYAMSIHKAQGCSLDLVRLDFARMFEMGQIYVGLSRVRTLEGLYIRNLNINLIKANPKAVDYYKKLESKSLNIELKSLNLVN